MSLGNPDGSATRRNRDLRRQNRFDVTDLLRLRGRLSRAELAKLTTLSPQGLAQILNELVESQVVVEVEMRGGQRGRGRPAHLYEFNPNRFCVLSLYVGLRYAELSLCDGLGRPLADNEEFTPGWDPAAVVEDAADRMQKMLISAGIQDRPCYVGVLAHGQVDEDLGQVTSQGMGWRDVPVGPMLAERTGLDVGVYEASRAAAIAESREGAAAGSERAVVLNSGPEMMATLVVEGQLETGGSGQAGMVGACVVATSKGTASVDSLIGSVASVARYNESAESPVTWMTEVYRHARSGDTVALAVIDLQVEVLSFVACWVMAIHDPERLVFSGAIGDFPESHRAKLYATIVDQVDPRILAETSIRFSTIGRQAWIRGGVHASLGRQRLAEQNAA